MCSYSAVDSQALLQLPLLSRVHDSARPHLETAVPAHPACLPPPLPPPPLWVSSHGQRPWASHVGRAWCENRRAISRMEGGTALHLQDASPCCTTPLPTTLPRPSTTRWEVLSHSWFAFFFVGWLLQMDESLTVGLHRPIVVAQLGKPCHSRWPVTPPQLSDTTGKAASLSVVRHTATVVSGTTGKAGSLPVVSHTATVVKHNWESCGLLHPSDATVHTEATDKGTTSSHVGWLGAGSTLPTSLWTMVNSSKL